MAALDVLPLATVTRHIEAVNGGGRHGYEERHQEGT